MSPRTRKTAATERRKKMSRRLKSIGTPPPPKENPRKVSRKGAPHQGKKNVGNRRKLTHNRVPPLNQKAKPLREINRMIAGLGPVADRTSELDVARLVRSAKADRHDVIHMVTLL